MKKTPETDDSTELFAIRDAQQRCGAAFVRIAVAHGIDSPLVLMAMAQNDDENYAEILARHVEQSMANNTNTMTNTTESTDEAGNDRMQRLVSLYEQVGFEMLPTGNGKFIVDDPTGGDGLKKLRDQFASLPRYEIDTASGIGGQDCWIAPDQDPSGEWVRWEDIEKIIGDDVKLELI